MQGEWPPVIEGEDEMTIRNPRDRELIEDLREALKEIAEIQPKVLGYIRREGFVFDDIGTERGNWQHLAFSIYSDLCRVDLLARQAHRGFLERVPVGKVTGETPYSGDLSMKDMLHMKLLFAGRPHARVLWIKTHKAEAAPGVVAVYTAKDVPVNEYGLQWQDQPVLCGPNQSLTLSRNRKRMHKPGADVVRFVGDQVAAVVAYTEAQAAAAVKLIEVGYEDLPVVTDPMEAMKPDAPRVHEHIGDSNVCVHYKIRKGDVEAGFEQADLIVEGARVWTGDPELPWAEAVAVAADRILITGNLKYDTPALDAMEAHLARRAFMVGDRYSLADISLYAYTHVAEEGGFDRDRYPSIRAWLDRVASRPGHVPMDA